MTDFILPRLTESQIMPSGAQLVHRFAFHKETLVLVYEWSWQQVKMELDLQVWDCGARLVPTLARLNEAPHNGVCGGENTAWLDLRKMNHDLTASALFCENVFLFHGVEPLSAAVWGSELLRDLQHFAAAMPLLAGAQKQARFLPPLENVRPRECYEIPGRREPCVEARGRDGSRFFLAQDLHHRWHYCHEYSGHFKRLPYRFSIQPWIQLPPLVYEDLRATYVQQEELAFSYLRHALESFMNCEPKRERLEALREKSTRSFHEWAQLYKLDGWDREPSKEFLREVLVWLHPHQACLSPTPELMEQVLTRQRPPFWRHKLRRRISGKA